jgi:hypothetical protein
MAGHERDDDGGSGVALILRRPPLLERPHPHASRLIIQIR